MWALVQAAPDIIVEQYRQKGGNLAVAKGATHLPNTGIKKDGVYRMTPVTSFFVKSFRDRVLVLSGYSVSASANSGKVLPPPIPLLLLLGAALMVVAPLFNPPPPPPLAGTGEPSPHGHALGVTLSPVPPTPLTNSILSRPKRAMIRPCCALP